MTTPGFSTAPCAVELGCSHAGRGTPKSQMQAKELGILQGDPGDRVILGLKMIEPRNIWVSIYN